MATPTGPPRRFPQLSPSGAARNAQNDATRLRPEGVITGDLFVEDHEHICAVLCSTVADHVAHSVRRSVRVALVGGLTRELDFCQVVDRGVEHDHACARRCEQHSPVRS